VALSFKNPNDQNTIDPSLLGIALLAGQKFPGLVMTSGGRSPSENAADQGAVHSHHLIYGPEDKATAADFRLMDPTTTRALLDFLRSEGVKADIHVKGTAPHIHTELESGGSSPEPSPQGAGDLILGKGSSPENPGTAADLILGSSRQAGALEKSSSPVDAEQTPPVNLPGLMNKERQVFENLSQTGESLKRRLGVPTPQESGLGGKLANLAIDFGPGMLGSIAGEAPKLAPWAFPQTSVQAVTHPIGAAEDALGALKRFLVNPILDIGKMAMETTSPLRNAASTGERITEAAKLPLRMGQKVYEDPSRALGDALTVLGLGSLLKSGPKGAEPSVSDVTADRFMNPQIIKAAPTERMAVELQNKMAPVGEEPSLPKVIKRGGEQEPNVGAVFARALSGEENLPGTALPKVIKVNPAAVREAEVREGGRVIPPRNLGEVFDQALSGEKNYPGTANVSPIETPRKIIPAKEAEIIPAGGATYEASALERFLRPLMKQEGVHPDNVATISDTTIPRVPAIRKVEYGPNADEILLSAGKTPEATIKAADALKKEIIGQSGRQAEVLEKLKGVPPAKVLKGSVGIEREIMGGQRALEDRLAPNRFEPQKIIKKDRGITLGSGFGGLGEIGFPKSKLAQAYREEAPLRYETVGYTTGRTGQKIGQLKLDPVSEQRVLDSVKKDIGKIQGSKLRIGTEELQRQIEEASGRFSPILSRAIKEPAEGMEAAMDRSMRLIRNQVDPYYKYREITQKYGEGTLSPKEKAYLQKNPEVLAKVQRYDQINRTLYDKLHTLLTESGVKVPYRQDYYRHMGEIAEESLATSRNPFVKSKEATFRHMKRQEGRPYTNDAYTGLMGYAQAALRLYHSSKLAPQVRAIAEAVRPKAPHLAAAIDRFAEEGILGKEHPAQAIKDIPGVKGALATSGHMVGNIVHGSVSIAMQQPASLAAVASQAGPVNMARGILSALKPGSKDFWYKHSPEYAVRASDLEYSPSWGGKANKFTSKLFEVSDRFVTRAALESFYQKGLKEGLSQREALRFANEWAQKTQNSLLRVSTPELLKNPATKWALPLQRFTFNLWNFVTKDLPRLYQTERTLGRGKVGSLLQLQGAAFKFGAAVLAVNAAYRATGLKEPYDVQSFLPGVGNARYGVSNPVLKTAWAAMQSLTGAVTHNKDLVTKGNRQLAQSLALLFVPQQAMTSAKGISAAKRGYMVSSKGKRLFDIKGAGEVIRSSLFGPYRTQAGQDYLNKMNQRKAAAVSPESAASDLLDQLKLLGTR
jgi:hypothetical protein